MKKFFEALKILIKQLNFDLEQAIARILFNNSMSLAIAESCTGGLISAKMTDVAGSSAYTKANFVTYSNEAKIDILGVNPATLEEHGAVSEECAREMAQGLFAKTNCDICIATTGIAGPAVVEDAKQVGLFYVAITTKYNTKVKRVELDASLSRRTLKFLFAQEALQFLLEHLNENGKRT